MMKKTFKQLLGLTLSAAMVIGMAGASLGHFLFGLVGFTAHGLAGFLVEVTGACLVISLARKIG